MHIRLEKSLFLKSLAHQQNVVERKTTVPILTHLLMEATFDGRVKLTGTDLELTVVETIPAVVQKEGSTAISAHLLYDIVRKLKDEAPIDIELNPSQSSLVLRCAPSQFTLQTLPASDFPLMTTHEITHSFMLTGGELRRLIDQTRFAMSTEEARYYLNGIYFHACEGDLRAVATDAHRLALTWLPLPPHTEGLTGAILSRKTVSEVRKLIDSDDTVIDVSLSNSQMSFRVNDVILYSRLVKGTFPDYQRAIPQGNDKVVDVETRLFSEAIDRVSMLSPDKTKAVKMHIHSGGITFSAQSPENGFACEDIPAQYTGDSLEMGFNARYVLDVVQQLKGDTFQIHISDATIPAIVKDSRDENALYVLMPMRV
ncbi:MAG: DNA polymerase III subunit beta [Holosporales bacterium]|jgi:DNA polymerase-3 subunit beta|nr:DNA polymerase III subunit beta [Holosporales bacterium]